MKAYLHARPDDLATGSGQLVSVVIPTYRRPRAVAAAVESVLSQTWRELEIIVVSDGPDPETRAALQIADTRLKYLELPENQGPAAARNAGVAASRGDWLTFLDDDDLMLPRKIEVQMQLADARKPAEMISCRTVYRHGNREDVWPSRPILPREDLADYMLRRSSPLGRPGIVPIQTLLLHRSLLDAVPFSNHADHEDWAWLLEVWHKAGARVQFAWEPLVIYRIETENATRSRRLNWKQSLEWAEQHRNWIGDRAFCCFLSTKAALKAKRAKDWKGLRVIGGTVLRNRPGLLDLLFLAGVILLPGALLQGAWKKSLQASATSYGALDASTP